VRTLATLGTGIAIYLDQAPVAIAMMAVLGAASAVQYPADRAIIVELVHDDRLERANGLLQTVMNVSNVAGPALAGILVASVGGTYTFFVAGAGYVLAFLTLLALRPRATHPPLSEENAPIWTNTVLGARYAFSDRPLIVLLTVICVMHLGFIGPFAVAMPAHVIDNLGGAPTTLAWLESGFAVGSILGAVIVASLWKKPGGFALIGSVLVVAVGQMVMALTRIPAVGVVALSIAGVASGVANVVLIAAVQRRTQRAFIGRVMSLVMVLSMGLAPVSPALTGSLGLSVAPWVVIFAGAMLTFAGGLLAIPVAPRVVSKSSSEPTRG